ncbi:MAG: phytanoyl-CoA dioxygenase family protein [Minicystis sp.]
MAAYVNPIELDGASSNQIRRDGYLKLAGLFTPDAVEGFRALLASQLRQLEDRGKDPLVKHAGGGEFAGYSNNVDLRGDVVKGIRESAELRRLCAQLDDGRWLLTQGLGFEISSAQKGLGWHWGFRSFCFTGVEDQGYTLWIPLDEVDPEKQNGGLPVVSESIYSGREETKMLAAYCHGQEDTTLLMAAAQNFAGWSSLRNAVLDKHMVEHAYQPGDALLFSRFVFHKSAPFLEGPQKRRRAFVMRLIPASATFNPQLFAEATSLFTKFNMHTHEDPVGLRLTDLKAGDPLGNSQFLARLY